MSGRCKSCNVELYEEELKTKWPNSDEYLDLCFACAEIALDPDSVNDYYDTPVNDHYEE